MTKITFQQNFNKKLYCRYFTTIRLDRPDLQPGTKLQVWLNGRYLYPAELIQKKSCFLNELPQITACLDTGMSLPETIQLIQSLYPGIDFRNTKVAILMLENLDYEAPQN